MKRQAEREISMLGLFTRARRDVSTVEETCAVFKNQRRREAELGGMKILR